MRLALACGLVVMVVACGGNVVVDQPTSVGGAGGTTGTTGTTVTTGTTATMPFCLGACSASSDGSCTCDAMCEGQKLLVDCQGSPSGSSCTCIENGIKIANCFETSATSCSVTEGCCASAFFGE